MSSVSGVSTNSNQYQVNWQNQMKQKQQEYEDLGKALQSGDLASAQTAYSSLLQNTSTNSQSNQTTTMKSDMDTLGQAIQSGDLSSAQTAFAKLQQDSQSVHGHHHHHHKQVAKDGTSSNSSTDPVQSASNNTGSISDTGIDISA